MSARIQTIEWLNTRVDELESAIRGALDRDGCRCDTSVCNWCKSGGWLQVPPVSVGQLKQALASNQAKMTNMAAAEPVGA